MAGSEALRCFPHLGLAVSRAAAGKLRRSVWLRASAFPKLSRTDTK